MRASRSSRRARRSSREASRTCSQAECAENASGCTEPFGLLAEKQRGACSCARDPRPMRIAADRAAPWRLAGCALATRELRPGDAQPAARKKRAVALHFARVARLHLSPL